MHACSWSEARANTAWGDAINDFNRCLEIEPDNQEAKQLKEMVYEILSYRYTDIYNP